MTETLLPPKPEDVHDDELWERLVATARKMGLSHPMEGLLCAPDRFVDCRHVYTAFSDIPESAEHEPILYQVSLMEGRREGDKVYPLASGYRRNKQPLKTPWRGDCFRLALSVYDEHHEQAVVTIFGATQQWKSMPVNEPIIMRGTASRFGRMLYFSGSDPIPVYRLGTIAPVYLGEQGKRVSGADVTELTDWLLETEERALEALNTAVTKIRDECGALSERDILELCADPDGEYVPESLIDWLSTLHDPLNSVEEGEKAREMGVRICALALQCRAYKQNMRHDHEKSPIISRKEIGLVEQAHALIEQVEAQQGFGLTKNQKEVIVQVTERLTQTRPMNGLLNGEVGSGKTLSYVLPSVIVQQNGGKVAILAPTDLLADQIAKGISEKFGDTTQVERVTTGKAIRNPDAILVGTKGLVTQARKANYVPNLVICDEQQKMDTATREALVSPYTHTLDVSATPIPRSLALSLYDGVDVFMLNEQPVKRQIKTVLIDKKERALSVRSIRDTINSGGRAAIVYTLVDGGKQTKEQKPSDMMNDKSAPKEDQVRALAVDSAAVLEQYFPNQVTLLHGKRSNDEKKDALASFRTGQTPLMVTTTIFETGIDVPDVKVLVIRDPQYLGMSQLHQLRGRLARNGGSAECYLLVDDIDALSDETYERLLGFTRTLDGHALAEQDMMNRGSGDLESSMQAGTVNPLLRGIKLKSKDLLTMRFDIDYDVALAIPQIKQTSTSADRI